MSLLVLLAFSTATLSVIILYLGAPLSDLLRGLLGLGHLTLYRGVSCSFTAYVLESLALMMLFTVTILLLRGFNSWFKSVKAIPLYVIVFIALLLAFKFTPVYLVSYIPFLILWLSPVGLPCQDGSRLCYFPDDLVKVTLCTLDRSLLMFIVWIVGLFGLLLGVTLEFKLLYLPSARMVGDYSLIPLLLVGRFTMIPATMAFISIISLFITLIPYAMRMLSSIPIYILSYLLLLIPSLLLLLVLLLPHTYTVNIIERYVRGSTNTKLLILVLMTGGLLTPLYLHRVYRALKGR